MDGMTSKTPTSIMLYGIPNCTSVKKGRVWLDEQGLPYTFHDFKKQGVPADALQRWVDAVGWETLVNRKGTTWRKLDEASRAQADSRDGAIALLLAQPSLIKRPVLVHAGRVEIGFSEAAYQALFAR